MSSQRKARIVREVEHLRSLTLRMGGLAEVSLDKSLRAVWARDRDLARQVTNGGREIDRIDAEIDAAFLNVLALRAPVASDLRQTLAIKTMATDLDRIGNFARDIACSATRLADRDPASPPSVLRDRADVSRRALGRALQAFADRDVEMARTLLDHQDAEAEEEEAIRQSLSRIRSSPTTFHQSVDFLLVAENLERITDHATHMAEEIAIAGGSLAHRLSDPMP